MKIQVLSYNGKINMLWLSQFQSNCLFLRATFAFVRKTDVRGEGNL